MYSSIIYTATRRAGLALAACVLLCPQPAAAQTAPTEEIVVTGTREGVPLLETPSSVTVIGDEKISAVKPGHPSEILNRVPGVTIQQTNGEGHITGIRQPVGTSSVYLYLEDGVPVRASGFFNHNALYEINLPMSSGIEVTRGPGTALQGSDAIGGIINVLTRAPSPEPEASVTLEAGSDTWLRLMGSASGTWGETGLRADLNLTHSDGWRDVTGYDRQSVTLRADRTLADAGTLKAVFAASNIDQETGANSALSLGDYLEDRTVNYYPIAFRKVQSARGSLEWSLENDRSLFSLIPYFRWSEMDLLATFMLRFDPTNYTTGYRSIGALAKYRHDFEPLRTRLIAGIDLDYSPGFRREDRISATRDGDIYTGYATVGRLYDYDVTFWQASPYLQVEVSPLEDLRLTAGLRYDVLGYDYENGLADGAFATVTPFGPRTFYRPADVEVDYTRASPSVGVTYTFTPSLNAFASFKQSFRVPQESNLFRQGANLDSLGLKPVVADSYEAGLRGEIGPRFGWDLSVYSMTKRDDILTLNTGAGPTQTNNGRTRHRGVEAAAGWLVHPGVRLDIAASYAEHEYLEWVTGSGVLSGNDISDAPAFTMNTTLAYTPTWLPALSLEAEWQHLGSYWMDDANTRKYGGHDLVNLRASYLVSEGLEVFGRLTNLFDSRWATTASVANGQPQFAPGMPLSLYAGLSLRF